MLAVTLLVSLLLFGCGGEEREVVAHVNEVRVACHNGQVPACIDYQTIQQECLRTCSRPGLVAGIKCHRCRAVEVIYRLGVFERDKGSGVWWVRYTGADGKIHRERVGSMTLAKQVYAKGKTEVREEHFAARKGQQKPSPKHLMNIAHASR